MTGTLATAIFDHVSVTQTFSQWAAAHQIAATPAATPQNDATTNLLKYVCDINPAQPMSAQDRSALPAVGLAQAGSKDYLSLTYRQNALVSGTTVYVQTSPDMQTWQVVTPDIVQQIGTDPNTGDALMEVEVDVTGLPTEFIRLNLTTQ